MSICAEQFNFNSVVLPVSEYYSQALDAASRSVQCGFEDGSRFQPSCAAAQFIVHATAQLLLLTAHRLLLGSSPNLESADYD
jgi:hypothetical protein